MDFSGLQSGFKQWGTVTNTDSPHDYTLPLSMSAALAAVANDVGGNCNSIGITPHASTVTIIYCTALHCDGGLNSGDKPTQNVPLRLILPSIEPYSWCWCLSETHDILLLSLVLILRT